MDNRRRTLTTRALEAEGGGDAYERAVLDGVEPG